MTDYEIVNSILSKLSSTPEHEAAKTALMRLATDAGRYVWLKERDLETIHNGGIFVGMVPQNLVINGIDLDQEVDAAMHS